MKLDDVLMSQLNQEHTYYLFVATFETQINYKFSLFHNTSIINSAIMDVYIITFILFYTFCNQTVE